MVMRGTNEGGRIDAAPTSGPVNWPSGADCAVLIDSLGKIVDMRWEGFRVGRLPKSSSAVSCSGFGFPGFPGFPGFFGFFGFFSFFGREGKGIRAGGCEDGVVGGEGEEDEEERKEAGGGLG